MDMPPEATYDTLAIISKLQPVVDGASANEVSLFAYLSCLLSVYRGNPPSGWGYQFSATSSYAPYSDDLSRAIERLSGASLLVETGGTLHLTTAGVGEYTLYSRLSRFSRREEFIDAACRSALAIPLTSVSASVRAEPRLRRALELSSTRQLLDESGQEAIREHFRALAEALPEERSLLVPAVVWLSYLATTISPVVPIADRDGGLGDAE